MKVGNARIEYFSEGRGEAVVLLPGGRLEVGYLAPLADALAHAGYRTLRINLRGTGRSTGPEEDVTYHTLANDVLTVMQSLHVGSAHIVGHAFGNRIARTLAADRPDVVRSVVLLAAGGKVAPASPLRDFQQTFNPLTARESDGIEWVKSFGGDPANAQRVWLKIKASIGSPRNTPTTRLDDWWAPRGQSEYLVVQGLKDLTAPAENGRLLKEELGTRVTLVEFPNAGHFMLVEEPDKTAEVVTAFLRRVDQTVRKH